MKSPNFNLKKYIKNQNLKLFDCFKFLRKINSYSNFTRQNILITFSKVVVKSLINYADISFKVEEVKNLKELLEGFDFPQIEPRKISKFEGQNSKQLFDELTKLIPAIQTTPYPIKKFLSEFLGMNNDHIKKIIKHKNLIQSRKQVFIRQDNSFLEKFFSRDLYPINENNYIQNMRETELFYLDL